MDRRSPASIVVDRLLEGLEGLDHLPRFSTQISLNDDDVEVEVVYDFDNIGEGDAGYAGKRDIAPWIEDVTTEDGTSIIDTLSKETMEQLKLEAYEYETRH